MDDLQGLPPDEGLSARARRHLRGLGQQLEASVFVGDAGISDGVIRALDEALGAHELVKVRMRQPADKKGMARELAERSDAALVGLVGHTALLYRRRPDPPQLELPA